MPFVYLYFTKSNNIFHSFFFLILLCFLTNFISLENRIQRSVYAMYGKLMNSNKPHLRYFINAIVSLEYWILGSIVNAFHSFLHIEIICLFCVCILYKCVCCIIYSLCLYNIDEGIDGKLVVSNNDGFDYLIKFEKAVIISIE